MKDKILKLCRRLKKCTLDELLSLTEEKEYIIKSALLKQFQDGNSKKIGSINKKHS